MGVVIFIINLKLLQLGYYAFTATLCPSRDHNELLELHKLQKVYQNEDGQHDDMVALKDT